MIVLTVSLSSASAVRTFPDAQSVAIAGTERRVVKSTINNVEYQVDVALPRDYAASNTRYPVLYVLDGNALFPLVTDTYRMLRFGLLRQEVIVVGIGYPESDYAFWSDAYYANRARDYTPKPGQPSSPRRFTGFGDASGGAPAFLRFLREELIPFIDANYRAAAGDRAILGHSYGGLFATYVLTHQPETFQKYAIGSPSLWFDDGVSFQWEADYAAAHKALPAEVYMYCGSLEEEVMTVLPTQFWKQLRTRHYAGLKLIDFITVPDEYHLPANLVGVDRALRSFYGPRPLLLAGNDLKRYTAAWGVANAPRWKTRVEHGRLVLEIPGSSLPPPELVAESATHFFSKGGWYFVDFTLDPRTKLAVEMTLNRPPYMSAGEILKGGQVVLPRLDGKSSGHVAQ
jgi:predicted alpha/beta superfamily hydrolase